MSEWFRVFAQDATEPSVTALLEYLEKLGTPMSGEFQADDRGWYQGELIAAGCRIELNRYLADEADIRSELNTWAAWLETQESDPNHASLMEWMIATQQLFTLRGRAPREKMGTGSGPPRASQHVCSSRPVPVPIFSLCESICRYLAQGASGVYQLDGQGFFRADGTLLLKED